MRVKIHQYIYFVGLCIIAFFLPLSEYISNAAVLLVVTNFLIELNYKKKLKKLIENKSILIFLLLFFVSVIWLFNTNNFDFAFRDIRIKLPLLALPVIFGTSDALSKRRMNFISFAFILGVLGSTLAGLFSYFELIPINNPDNVRNLSIFVSHIRLSLMICLSVLIIFYFIHERIFFTRYSVIPAVLVIVWFVMFLVMIQGFTGLISLCVVGLISLAVSANKETSKLRKSIYFGLVIGIPLVIVGYLGLQIKTFYSPTHERLEAKQYTINGNLYFHDTTAGILENGNLIYVDICEKELFAEWNKRSELKLEGEDANRQSLLHTLIRFLASKGLTKDAQGVASLTDIEVVQIENGKTNYKYAVHETLNKRVYNIIWQIDVYARGGNPSGHSITQRFEYMKAGLILAYREFWIGTGTGDIDDEYKSLYIERHSQLDSLYRHRAHNQFLTFFVSFGVIGGVLCLIAIFYPVISDYKFKNYLFGVFVLIMILSMLTDDTLETTTGVVFVSYFYSLFLWGEK